MRKAKEKLNQISFNFCYLLRNLTKQPMFIEVYEIHICHQVLLLRRSACLLSFLKLKLWRNVTESFNSLWGIFQKNSQAKKPGLPEVPNLPFWEILSQSNTNSKSTKFAALRTSTLVPIKHNQHWSQQCPFYRSFTVLSCKKCVSSIRDKP